MWPAVSQSSIDYSAVRYVFPVLWMMSCIYPSRRYASAIWYGSVCLSSLSVCARQYRIKTAEHIELVFGIEATLGLSCIVLYGNSGISKK